MCDQKSGACSFCAMALLTANGDSLRLANDAFLAERCFLVACLQMCLAGATIAVLA
jgi:hypothetical protein